MLMTAPQTTPAPEDPEAIDLHAPDLHAPVLTRSPPLRDDAADAPAEP